MRLSLLLLVSMLADAQAPSSAASDPAYTPLSKAYATLQDKQYDEAIRLFLLGIDAAPGRAAIRKDLAYCYLKVGENEAARDQFAAAMRIDPADFQAALEFAFLCHQTHMEAEARRVFDRVRVAGDAASRATAEQAFQNIDRPHGKSNYGLFRTVNVFIDIFFLYFFVRYFDRPLRIFGKIAVATFGVAIVVPALLFLVFELTGLSDTLPFAD